MKYLMIPLFSLSFAFQTWALSDYDLTQILQKSALVKTSGIIYSWSPRMNLSILGAQEIFEIATRAGLEVTFVIDPEAQENEINEVKKDHSFLEKSSSLTSSKLISMNMKIHYPSLILYKNGEILPVSRPGYDEPDRARAYLLRRFQ